MHAPCSVRLIAGGPLVPGLLTTDRAESSYGLPVVVVDDEALAPIDVAAVCVSADCPIELADAAVQAGYYVLGRPCGQSEPTYSVIRQTIDGERSIVAAGLSQTEAEELADHHTAGPDGMAVGCRFATYAVEREGHNND